MILCFAGLFVVLAHVFAQSLITTYAGPQLPVSGTPALNQAVDFPSAVIPDGTGGVYVVSTNQSRVYDIAADGTLRLVAGSSYGFSGDGGPATNAKLASPSGLARDSMGNLYIADTRNNRIRKITRNGVITTIAGTDTAGFSGDGGPASVAQLSLPGDVAVDETGNIYFTDQSMSPIGRVRRIGTDGVITTVAGGGNTSVATSGIPATSAALSPTGIAVDPAGNLYIATGFVVKVGRDGMMTPLAQRIGGYSGRGGFVCSSSGDGGPASASVVCYPNRLALDSSGSLYLTDGNTVRKITTDGIIRTIAGGDSCNPGASDGQAATSFCLRPFSIAVDNSGSLYISEADISGLGRSDPSRIRKVTADGLLTTIVANSISGFAGDGGPARFAQLAQPGPLAVDTAGNLYFADYVNNRIREVTADGVIHTIAGNGIQGFAGDGGPATSAEIDPPIDLFVDSLNNVYMLEDGTGRVRKITTDAVINTIAGCYGVCSGGPSQDGIPATQATLFPANRIAVDAAGTLYIAQNDRVRKVGTDGIITTVVTFGSLYPNTNVVGFAPDPADGFYIRSQLGNCQVLKLSPDGSTTLVAGAGPCGFGGEGDGGPATSAELSLVTAVKQDGAGNIYLAEPPRVREVSTDGIIRTVAGGINVYGFSGDGGPATSAQFDGFFNYIAVDSAGNIYVSDNGNNRIRKVVTSSTSTCGTTAEPLMTLNLQPGFYIAEVRNKPGTPGGFWGMEVRAQLGSLAGGLDLGGGTFTAGGLTSFGAFYFPSGGPVHIKVNTQPLSGTGPFSMTLRVLDATHQPIMRDQAAGTSAEFDTPSLAPGFYIVEVRTPENAPTATYQMQIGTPGIGVVADAGGYVNDGIVGFGAFYISQTQDVGIKVFGTSAYGAAAASCTALTLRNASGQVIQTAP
jgi:hypothetical protein